jgi:hypothetical protein
MARRTTDLLDVFRDRGASGRGGKPETAPSAKPEKKPFEGLFLYPRQLLLGSSVVVLLLVFAFVLGLSVGRRGSTTGGSALQGVASRADDAEAHVRRVYVLGRVPFTNATGLAANEPRQLFDALTSDRYGVDATRLWIAADPNDEQWVVILGPFATEKDAADYLMSHRLMRGRVGATYPFQTPAYRSYLPSDLPRTRLPAPR